MTCFCSPYKCLLGSSGTGNSMQQELAQRCSDFATCQGAHRSTAILCNFLLQRRGERIAGSRSTVLFDLLATQISAHSETDFSCPDLQLVSCFLLHCLGWWYHMISNRQIGSNRLLCYYVEPFWHSTGHQYCIFVRYVMQLIYLYIYLDTVIMKQIE